MPISMQENSDIDAEIRALMQEAVAKGATPDQAIALSRQTVQNQDARTLPPVVNQPQAQAQPAPQMPSAVQTARDLMQQRAQHDQQYPTYKGGLLSGDQKGVLDILRNPDQAQVNAGLGALFGVLNPKNGQTGLTAASNALGAFGDQRGLEYKSAVAQHEAGTESLKDRLAGVTSIGNLENATAAEERAGRREGETVETILVDGKRTRVVFNKKLNKVTSVIGEVPAPPGMTEFDKRGFKIPQGYMLKNPEDPREGVVPIPGGPDAKLTPEQSGKAQMITGALQNMDVMDRFMFEQGADGKVDYMNPSRANIINANIPFGGTPGTEGRSLNVLIDDSIQAKLRAETGAAAPEPEVVRLNERYRPSIFDSGETIRLKRSLLQQFLAGTWDKFDPTGLYDRTGTIDAAVKQADGMLDAIKNRDKPKQLSEIAPEDLKAKSNEDLFNIMMGK